METLVLHHGFHGNTSTLGCYFKACEVARQF